MISRSAKHYLIFQMGLIKSTPTNIVKVPGGIKGAVSVMVRQIVSNPLNEIAADPGFQAGAPAPVAVPAPAPAETPAANPVAATVPQGADA